MLDSYLPVLVIVAISAVVGLAIIILSTVLSLNKDPSRIKLMPYECGMDPIGDARRRFSVRFFLIGMLFIVFDIELIFFFPWATIYEDLRMFGFVEMLIFVLVLLVGLGYVWRKGALQWE
ncbi:MAG: NADH-quinone oxidoreductase subunit A [Desulfomonile sp.]|nr:NADH-quinone oxidoreductase subunit A [Desulfomonile sp.]